MFKKFCRTLAFLLLLQSFGGAEPEADWEKITEHASWSAREADSLTVFKNKLWLIGGGSGLTSARQEVWSSDDGSSWTLVTAQPPWHGRYGHTCLVFEEKLWLLGGYSYSYSADEIWYSND